MRSYIGPSVRSVSAREAVPEVRNKSRGLEDLRSKGAQSSVRTWVPETLMSQLWFQSSRVLSLPWEWAGSRAAPALLMRTSRVPLWEEERVETAEVMEESEVRSMGTTLMVLLVFGSEEEIVVAASLPFCSSRDPRMMLYGVDDSQRACTVARPTAADQHWS